MNQNIYKKKTKIMSLLLAVITVFATIIINCSGVSAAGLPTITASSVDYTTITWNVTYPSSGSWGNKLELYNCSTGVWTNISGTNYTTDGTYTSTNLTSGTQYMGRLTWYSNGWKTKDVYVTTQEIKNSSFEYGIDLTPDSWNSYAGTQGNSVLAWEANGGINNSKCISITSNSPNDVWWSQTINVEPGKVYGVKAFVKGQNITGRFGATLSISGTWSASGENSENTGTFDWKEIGLTFIAPSNGQVEIACRLGMMCNPGTGKAWFDDLKIYELPEVRGRNISLFLENSDLTAITNQNLNTWVTNLDSVYDQYSNLVGTTPYNNEHINVLSTYQYGENSGYWAVAGNPILWKQEGVKEELQSVNSTGQWSFGIMHEIGHDFDNVGPSGGSAGWNWNGEFWANFKMYYAVEQLNAKVIAGNGVAYTGTELTKYYKTDSQYGSYDNTIANGTFSQDALLYCFIRIRNSIGWEPFKSTFRYFVSTGEMPSTNLGKFNRFIELLQQYYNPNGNEVQNTFLPGEIDLIRNNL